MIGCIMMLCVGQVLGNWPRWGGDDSHTGLQLTVGAMSTAPVVKWSSPGWAEWQFSAAADCDGDAMMDVVFGTLDNKVKCVSGTNGAFKWSFSATGNIYGSSPTIANANGGNDMEVLVGDQNGVVYCLAGANGGLLWSFQTGAWVWSSPAVADVDMDGQNEIIFGSEDSKVYCISGTNGTEEWRYSAPGWVRSAPLVADVDGFPGFEVLFGVGGAGNSNGLYCLNAESGVYKWSFTTGNPGSVYGSPSASDLDGDGIIEVVFGTADGNIYAIRATNGSQKWVFPSGVYTSSSAALADIEGDGGVEVFIGAGNCGGGVYRFYCLNGHSGIPRWTLTPLNEVHTPPSIADVDGDRRFEVLFGTHDLDTLYAVNAEDGSVCWKVRPGDIDVHSPFPADVDGDGCLEILTGTSSGFYALDDPGNASGCGAIYTEEGSGFMGLDFKPIGRGFYLFLPNQVRISLRIYDAQGRFVQSLYDGVLGQGGHTFRPDLRAKGVYFAVLRYQGWTRTIGFVR